mmetsp:Transcript_106084/g.208077  ORF Transcript_106084/g.208077 Transcript_106084/m.208077 type:complete len:113 (+) Transcript_106084:488-826(+)
MSCAMQISKVSVATSNTAMNAHATMNAMAQATTVANAVFWTKCPECCSLKVSVLKTIFAKKPQAAVMAKIPTIWNTTVAPFNIAMAAPCSKTTCPTFLTARQKPDEDMAMSM